VIERDQGEIPRNEIEITASSTSSVIRNEPAIIASGSTAPQ
jgi:hypothetical protein